MVVTAMFTCPLGDDAALLPRTPALAGAYHELMVANQDRLAQWDPWALKPQTMADTRAFLERNARDSAAGTQLPVVIAVPTAGGWRLAGSAGLRINPQLRSAEGGYWIDAAFEGRGLVTRTMTALLDQAFGPLGLGRAELRIDPRNHRSRAVAERLGFTAEGVLRQAIAFPDERRDDVVYGLLADEWAGGR